MPQSLIQLPETASFEIRGWDIIIRNHEITDCFGLFGLIFRIANGHRTGRNILFEFEKHKISFEAAIECCAYELENTTDVLASAMNWRYYSYGDFDQICKTDAIFAFTKSDAGRIIAGQFVEKIRSCDNWKELYDEMHQTSRFQHDMVSRMIKWVKQCPRV